MDDNSSVDSEYRQKIIEKCINSSYQTGKAINNSPNIKNKIFNVKNILKYNVFNHKLNKKFTWVNDGLHPVHLFHKIYLDESKFNKKLDKLILITYRTYYKKQISLKTKSSYTSDCGWGCMIRSSQMIFSRMIYKIFKYQFKRCADILIIKSVIPFFLDNYINLEEITTKTNDCFNIVIQDYINRLNDYFNERVKDNNDNNKIQLIDPPFSIHKICMIGEIFGRTCGEWFSDYEIPKIFEIINSTFNIIPSLEIIHFDSDINIKKIIEKCFQKEDNTNEINEFSNGKENNFFINEKKEKYIFKKIGGIFVSVRLGVKAIPSEYYKSIKKLFECKQFLGFIGGKINEASYFIGYKDNDLLYLDPHLNQESLNDLNENNLMTYTNKNVYHLPFKSMQCSFTIGFLIRNCNEFKDLSKFFQDYCEDDFPCFHVFEDIKKINTLMQKEINININNDEEDF